MDSDNNESMTTFFLMFALLVYEMGLKISSLCLY